MEVRKVSEFPVEMQALFVQVSQKSRGAFAPLSNFGVCACLVDCEGNRHFGINCETANHDSTCAERGAIVNYVMAGRKGIKMLVIFGAPINGSPIENEFTTPCGQCRQALVEHLDPETHIFCLDQAGQCVLEVTMGELLPKAFSLRSLGL